MIALDRARGLFARFPLGAAAIYLALIVVFVFMATDGMFDVLQKRNDTVAATDILSRMETRAPTRAGASSSDVGVPTGSPFLEGASASVAGAALLQRVIGATRRAKGNVLSSQVDLQGPQSKAGFISATSSFEIEPGSLQQLLYDLEAGMPFLFVDQLVVQAPTAAGEGGKLRVLLAVSGQWQGAK
jgi:general secretion pathway protein M